MTIQLEKLVAKLELDNKGFKAGLIGAAAGITALIGGMGVAVKATFDWANDLDQLGDVMDGTNKQFAALAFVARKSGVGVDTLTKANVLLEKSLFKADGRLDTVGQKLRAYGIRVKDINGNVKDSVRLTDEIAKKYAQLSTQTERINFLTEIYGKNGAALVDFFDTLNSEGGISAVTKKVEALGLAIDPSRYEKFNRNLEELKLIGLGLAVSFTEKIMPVLEGFLGWVGKAAASPKFQEFKKKIADLFNFDERGSKFDLKNKGLQKSFDNKLSKMTDDVDWAGLGEKLGQNIDEWLRAAVEPEKQPQSVKSVGKAISDFFTAAIGPQNLVNWNVFEAVLTQQIRTSTLGAFGKATSGLGTNQIWYNVGFAIINTMTAGLAGGVANFYSEISRLQSRLEQKLTDIAKVFFNRGMGWMNQLRAGLNNALPGLLSSIQGIVDQINAILKSIKGVSIGVGLPNLSNLFGGQSSPKPNSPVANDKRKLKNRATGGAVIGGQAYNVVELNKPERFTPFTAGRIDPVKPQTVTVNIDYNKLARAMVQQRLKGNV